MDCGQAQMLFTTYLDQELPNQDLLQLENHLATCPACAREWFFFRETLQRLRTIEIRPVPSDLLPGIHAKLATPQRGISFFLKSLFGPVPVTVTASLLAAILFSSIFFRIDLPNGGQNPPPEDRAAIASRAIPSEETGDAPVRWAPSAQQTLPDRLLFSNSRLAGGRREPPSFFPAISLPAGKGSATDPSFAVNWSDDFTAFNEQGFPFPSICNRQIGQPLTPDIIIRLHAASPSGLRKMYRRVVEKGTWQTRLYRDDYFLVLINPEDLASLYHLLQQHYFLFSQDSGYSQTSPPKTLLVAVRP